MSEKQLQQFTTNAAASLSSAQREVLSSDQRYALEQAAVGVKYKRRSSAAVALSSPSVQLLKCFHHSTPTSRA